MTLNLFMKRLLLGAVPTAVLVCAAGCAAEGETYAEPAPAAYYEGPTYYAQPNVYYAHPEYHHGWDHDRHHYVYRSYPRYEERGYPRSEEHRSGVDVHAHF